MKTVIDTARPRNILCVYPRHTNGYPNFSYAFRLFPNTKALMPPLGLLIIAAYLPRAFHVRFVDEDVCPATDADYRWADVIMTSGTHSQRHLLIAIAERARRFGKLSVIGGPSASACPEDYPQFDIIHAGELGDATDELITAIEAGAEMRADPAAPPRIFRTKERLPIEQFPIPAYHLLQATDYLMLNIQWSSGCPYTCEFCDIPELYGRKPRYKTPGRLIEELDAIVAQGPLGAVFFVDDNLVGNRRAFRQVLVELVAWQKRNGYPLRFVGESSLNLAQDEEILRLMRDAAFIELFIGIETAEVEALLQMSKAQNVRMPMLEAVRRINDHGISVSAGIILGLDTDTDRTVDNICEFIEQAHIPLAVINMLYAPPKTPLRRRLEAEGRLIEDSEVTDSNIRFKAPAEVVRRRWEDTIRRCFEPSAVFARFRHAARFTHPNRAPIPRRRVSWSQVKTGVSTILATIQRLGIEAPYRGEFWWLSLALLRRGDLEALLHFAAMGYHMIQYREEVLAGNAQPCIHTEAAAKPGESRPEPLERLIPLLSSRPVKPAAERRAEGARALR